MANYENKQKGYVAIFRSLQDHWIWEVEPSEKYSKGQAWIDLLLSVNYKENKMLFDNKLIIVHQGERVTSIKKLADKWHWSRTSVRKFLELLKQDDMIEYTTNNKGTWLKVLNYSDYQENGNSNLNSSRTSDEHQMNIKRTSDEHQMNTNNKVNQVNQVNKVNQENHIELCSELQASSKQNTGRVIDLPLNTGELHSIYQHEVAEWTSLYPSVDVEQELRKMKGWLASNPSRRKTKRGIKSFVNNWLSREQDKGGNRKAKVVVPHQKEEDSLSRLGIT